MQAIRTINDDRRAKNKHKNRYLKGFKVTKIKLKVNITGHFKAIRGKRKN